MDTGRECMLSDLELEEIQRNIEDIVNVETERSNVFVIKMNMQIPNKDMTILEKMRNVLLKETRERLLPPRRALNTKRNKK